MYVVVPLPLPKVLASLIAPTTDKFEPASETCSAALPELIRAASLATKPLESLPLIVRVAISPGT